MNIALIFIVPLLLVSINLGLIIFYRYSKNLKLKKAIFFFSIFKDKIYGFGEFVYFKGKCLNCGARIEETSGLTHKKRAELNQDALFIFFGDFFNRNSIKLDWDIIEGINTGQKERVSLTTVYGPFHTTSKVEQKIENLQIILKRPLPKKAICLITNVNKKSLFPKKLSIDVNGKLLIIKTPPRGGFNRLLSKMTRYLKFDVKMLFEDESWTIIFARYCMVGFFSIIASMMIVFLVWQSS